MLFTIMPHGLLQSFAAFNTLRAISFTSFADNPEKKKEMTSGFTLLTQEDIADAIMFAIKAPWRMNVSLIEITPTEQAPGGAKIEGVS